MVKLSEQKAKEKIMQNMSLNHTHELEDTHNVTILEVDQLKSENVLLST